MNSELWARLEPLLDQIDGLAESDRRAFLERLEGGQPELARELAAYLTAERAAVGFLEDPLEVRAGPLLEAIGRDCTTWEELQLASEQIGPYRVLRELGRGGMGAVFLAERADGQFEQRVALKLLQHGRSGADLLARFRTERQILARLQHANIARLLDGGATAAGQPYFAMELVDGAALVGYCDARRLTVDERLLLFLQVCDAVDYAHRNLVVHRDLKPSNIFVTSEGQVKLLDFGIAKVLEPAAGEDPEALTLLAGRLLTPQYAAPEQLLGQPITTATDVYSLGVVLYELLCGRSPYHLHGLPPREVERLVAEREPDSPSVALLRGSAEPLAAAIAAARGVGVERLARRLRGDLDNIVRVALRKEPARRYLSADALARDLRNVLEGLPVSARADTFGYRGAKFVRRHAVAVAAASLVAVSLLGGLVSTLWQAREAMRQATKAEEVKRFAFELFEVADPDVAKGREISARELLKSAPLRIRAELANQPAVEAEMLLLVGAIHHRLGMNRESQPLFERALELRRALADGNGLGVAEAEIALGGALFAQGQFDRAEKLFASALTVRARELGENRPETAAARGLLGRVRFEGGDLGSAESLLSAAIAGQRALLPAGEAELAANLSALGRVLQAKGDLAGAEAAFGDALARRRRIYGEQHSSVSEGLLNLAGVMTDRGDIRGAVTQYRALLATDRRLFGDTHEAIALDLNNLGANLVVLDACVEAQAVLGEAVAVYGRLYGEDSPQLAPALHNLSRARRCVGELAAAELSSREALARAIALIGENHRYVDRVREQLARILNDRGKTAEAERLASRAVAGSRSLLPADHPWLADALTTLAEVLVSAQRSAEAEPLLVEASTLLERKFGRRDWRAIEGRLALHECRMALRQPGADAAGLATDYPALVAALGSDHPLAARLRRAASLTADR